MEQVVVFGCGETADSYFDKISKRFTITAYADNNPNLWGKEKNGVKIIAPAQIPNDISVLAASQSFYPEIIASTIANRDTNLYVLVNGEILAHYPGNNQTDKLEFDYPPHETNLKNLQLGLSSVCNSKCQYCLYHSEHSGYQFHQGFMSESVLEKVIKQISALPSHDNSFEKLSLIGDGETLLHPQWFDFVCRVLRAKSSIQQCVIYTNGMLLTQENVEKLQQVPVEKLDIALSVDGLSPEDCEYWRKGEKFSIIRKNINNAFKILEERANFIITGCVVLPQSIDVTSARDVEGFLKYSSEWLKHEFPFAKCIAGLALPFIENIPGTKIVEASVFPKICTCDNPFHHIAIFANGDILSCPCGYIFKNNEDFRIGNVKKDNLMNVFYDSPIFNQLRNDLMDGKKPVLCGRCNQLGGSSIRCLQRTESEGFYR